MALISDFLTNQDPKEFNSIFSILGVHNEYLNHYKRWQYLIKSYLGGYEYRMGQYLSKYVYETDSEYLKRLSTTPLENHVKAVTHIYNSYLFRTDPKREYGNLDNFPELEMLKEDADFEGRTFDSFMREVNIMSTVYGHCLVMVEKPKSNALTRAEELNQQLRPYLNLYTPLNILDWSFKRQDSGVYELVYLKLIEVENASNGQPESYYIREYTKDTVSLYSYNSAVASENELIEQVPNELGIIPAVWVYANRSPVKGIGVSDVGDVADMANSIYNDLSELEQLIRLTNHPSLVKTPEVEASAGAGAMVIMPNETDPGLKPYLLQPNASSIDGILNSIATKVRMIDRMAHMGAIRSIETRQTSGISQIAEFQLLDTRLSEKARNLELAEEQIFRLFGKWLGVAWDGQIKYPRAFHLKDKSLDIDTLKKAADSNPANPVVKEYIDYKILEALSKDDDELNGIMEKYHSNGQEPNEPNGQMTLPTNNGNGNDSLLTHLKEMIASGASDEEIIAMHPELER